MSYAKIESSGCTVQKGKVQLRFSFYLEPDDPRYEEYHIQVPIIPPEGYQGEVSARDRPVDTDDYNQWRESLPKEWQNNPFHNHFVYVDPDTTDTEIKQLMAESLDEFFAIWGRGEDILKVWKPKGRFVAGDSLPANARKCQQRVEDIRGRDSEFSFGRDR